MPGCGRVSGRGSKCGRGSECGRRRGFECGCGRALAEAVTRLADGPVGDDVWAAAAGQFEQTEPAELLWLITTVNAWNRISVASQAWPVNE